MSTSIVDGTVEEAVIRTDRAGIKIFKTLRLRGDDGKERVLQKAVTTKEVGDELVPGARGRFYLYKSFDIKGVHGVRTPDGRAVYGFPGNNQKLFVIMAVVSIAWVSLRIFANGDVPLLGVATLILAGFGWYFMNKGKQEAQAQFDGDAG